MSRSFPFSWSVLPPCALLLTALLSSLSLADPAPGAASRPDSAALSPRVRSAVKRAVRAQLAAPRGSEAALRAGLVAELAQLQDMVRRSARTLARGDDDPNLALAAAERDRLMRDLPQIRARSPRVANPRDVLRRGEAKLDELSDEIDALMSLPDGPARRSHARALLDRMGPGPEERPAVSAQRPPSASLSR